MGVSFITTLAAEFTSSGGVLSDREGQGERALPAVLVGVPSGLVIALAAPNGHSGQALSMFMLGSRSILWQLGF
jgi:hypothetical protein